MSETIELLANGLAILIIFPVYTNNFASVSSLHLSIRFALQDKTIWVEREIYDTDISLLLLTMCENPRVADNGSSMWELCVGKYIEYGFPDSCTNVYTKIRIPPHSSSTTLNTLPMVKVKIEPGIHTYIFLIPWMVMSPLYPLPFRSHPHPLSVLPLLPRLLCILVNPKWCPHVPLTF